MNLLDLPGIVAAPDEIKQATETLVTSHVVAHRESSVFLAIVPAVDSPRDSPALALVARHALQDRTIGVITKCDRLEDEEHELLRERLANERTETSVVLEPYGCAP